MTAIYRYLKHGKNLLREDVYAAVDEGGQVGLGFLYVVQDTDQQLNIVTKNHIIFF